MPVQNKKKKSKKKVLIIGARLDGYAGAIWDTLELTGEYEIVGFVDSAPELQKTVIRGVPVVGSTNDLFTLKIKADCAHIAVGDNVARWEIYNVLKKRGLKVVTLIHPTAIVSKQAQIAEGCFVGARAVINHGVAVGPVTIINTGCIVEHNNKLGAAVHLAAGASTSGRVQIDDFAFIGMSVNILPDIHVGSGSLIGPGATVTKNVPAKNSVKGYATKPHSQNIYVDAVRMSKGPLRKFSWRSRPCRSIRF